MKRLAGGSRVTAVQDLRYTEQANRNLLRPVLINPDAAKLALSRRLTSFGFDAEHALHTLGRLIKAGPSGEFAQPPASRLAALRAMLNSQAPTPQPEPIQ